MNINKTTSYDAGNIGFGLGQTHICDGVKLLDLPQITTYTKILTFGREDHKKGPRHITLDISLHHWISNGNTDINKQ